MPNRGAAIAAIVCVVVIASALPAAANRTLPTIEQLRDLFDRAGLAVNETSERSETQVLYTLDARDAGVHIQALTEGDAVQVIQGSFPLDGADEDPRTAQALIDFLLACCPGFADDCKSGHAWEPIYTMAYSSWCAQLIGAAPGGPWYGPMELDGMCVAVAYVRTSASGVIGLRFAHEASRLGCNVHPDVSASRFAERIAKPTYLMSAEPLLRYPERYRGQAITFVGEVKQKVDDTHYVIETHDKNRVYVCMMLGANATRVLKGDTVAVLGIGADVLYLRTVLGSYTELPAVLALYLR